MTKTRNDTKRTDFNSMIQHLTRETEEDSSRVELIMLAALASTLGQRYLVSSGEDLVTLGYSVGSMHATHRRVCPLLKFATQPLESYCGDLPAIRKDIAKARQELENLKKAVVNDGVLEQAQKELNYHAARRYSPGLLQRLEHDQLLEQIRVRGALYISKGHVEAASALSVLTTSDRLSIPLLMNKTWEMETYRTTEGLSLTLFHLLLSLNETGLRYLLQESGLYSEFQTSPMLLLPKVKKRQLDLSKATTYWAKWLKCQASSFQGSRTVIRYEPEAQAAMYKHLDPVYDLIDQHALGSRLAWFCVLPYKLAALCALTRGGAVITLKDVERASQLTTKALEMHLQVLESNPINESGMTIKLTDSEARMLKKVQKRAPVASRDLQRSFHRVTPEEFQKDLASLLQQGLVQETEAGLVASEFGMGMVAYMADK